MPHSRSLKCVRATSARGQGDMAETVRKELKVWLEMLGN